jgi:hypothetical protein
MLFPKVLEAPFPISIIETTAMMPITIPSIVSIERITLRRSAVAAEISRLMFRL